MALNQRSNAGAASEADSIKALAAMIAGTIIGEGSVTCIPFLVGGIAERYQLADGASGMIASVQFAAMGGASVLLAATVHKIDRRRFSIVAGLAIMFGHLIAILSGSWEIFLLGRILAGFGEGTALSIASAAAAVSKNPQRTYSILAFTLVVNATILYSAVPALAEYAGPVSVFYVLMGLSLCTFPILFWIPDTHRSVAEVKNIDTNIWKPFPWALVGISCFFIGPNSLWAYAERIGTSVGIGAHAIGAAFVAATVVATLGPVLAHFVERRWGNRIPIQLGIVTMTTGLLMLAATRNHLMFFSSVILFNFAYMFLMPYFQALAAFIDPSGRLIVASIFVRTTGIALAPFLGGAMLTAGGSFMHIGLMSTGLVVASFLLIAKVARQADAAKLI